MATATEQITGTYVLDPIHSSASFAVKHMVVSTFRGRFEKFDATLIDGKLVGTVDVGSIVVKDENLAAHLQSPEFFDAGELTIKGITKSVEARGTLEGPAVTFGDVNKIGLTLEAIIDRTEFGLNWNAPLPKGGFALANDVKLIVELELAEQA